MNVVSFSDGNSWTKKTYDSVINDESITYYQTSDWYSIPENKDQVRKSISTYLDRLEASGGTHTAGGLVGANVVLRNDEISSSGNPKVVLLMTDGGATYARDGRGNSIGNGSNQYNTAVQKATEDQLSKLKESQQNLKIYAVGYQTDSTVLDWLDPKQNNHVTEQLVEAENISDLINTMTQFVSSATSTTKLQNVVVTDQLNMNYVELEDVTFNEEIFKAPELYLKDGMIDGTDENDHKFIAENEKGTKLAITGYDDRIVTYDNGTATYDTTTNTITWNVADSMGSDTTKTLTYRVTAKWSEDTKSTGDSDTGTHSREEGYRSNVEATISYNDGAGTKEGTFKHPVVVPIVPRESLTIHKIVKMMDSSDDIPQDIKFKFEVCFNNGDKLNPTFQDEKVNWNEEKGVYEFELANAEQIIFQDIPINASYTISEIDIDEIGDDYVVTKVDAKNGDMGETIGSTGEGVYPDSFKVEQDILNSTRALNKNVVGSDEDKAKEFTFQVTDEENQPYGKNNGVYTLSDNDSALIKIQPEDADKTFIITETDSKDAWKTTVAKNDNTAKEGSSITAVAGNAVTFTNYYYDHSITLKKEIEGEELEPEVNYPFTIQFAVEPGKTLSAEDLTLKNSLGEKVDGWTLQGNTLTITLKKDESITISELPQYVTAYTITEGETTLAGNSYKVVLDHITVNGENADKVENVELDPDKDQNDTITFTNRYDYLYGYLKIDKVISDGSNTDSVFTFKVTNQDTKDVFYTTVDGDGETTLYVPLGKYTVEEVDSTVRYEKTSTVYEGDGDCAIVDADNVSEETPATVIVTNENTGHNYFSDVDTIVNTVENGNFKTTPTNVSSLDGYSSIAASTQTALEMNGKRILVRFEVGFPANGRTTLHGIHYVNGTRLDQSSFVRDPIHPTLEPELTKILAKQTDRPGAVFPYEWYGLPLTEQKEKLDDLRRENAYIVFDVRDQTDLHGLAVLLQDEKCLCGSSAIGQELPLVWGPGEGENPSPVHPVHDDTGTLLLAGSLTPQTSGQVEYLLGTGMASAQLDTMALFDPESRREQIDTLTRMAVKETGMGFPALICTEKNPERVRATKEAGYARGMSDEEVGRLVSKTLAEIARGTLEKTRGRKLVVAGGDTAATISRRLGVRKMVILDEIEPGVPTMYGYGDLGELLLVLKSGSFGSEPFLEKADHALCALQKGGAEKGEK